MPSFDVVSETNLQEVTNAVDQASRELSSRFDFKGTNARVELTKTTITLTAPSDFQLKQVDEILRNKLAKRNVDVRALKYNNPTVNLSEAKQTIEVKQGLETDMAKQVVKLIKDTNIKVQTAINGNQVRVTGKKRDDLQEVIAVLRGSKFPLPLQFVNFRE
jgi:uncharacterized protein YajQ (UPF0234 family)